MPRENKRQTSFSVGLMGEWRRSFSQQVLIVLTNGGFHQVQQEFSYSACMTGPLVIAGAELPARLYIHVLDRVLDDILPLFEGSSFEQVLSN